MSRKGPKDDDLSPMEPRFPSGETGTNATTELQLKSSENEAYLEEQLHLLKPQVDDIARISERELTSDQTDILKKYISIKEAEARDLRDQLRQYQAHLKKIGNTLENASRRQSDLIAEVETAKRREETLRGELKEYRDKYQGELAIIKNDYEEKLRLTGNLDAKAEEFIKNKETWKERVREDLKRIKLKERELENKYELLKRDTQALLDSKDKHVLELKKKNDALELEMETLEEKLRNNSNIISAIDSKKRRLIETMRLAITLLENIDSLDPAAINAPDPKRKAG